MKNIGALEREKIAQFVDIQSRTRLTQVSKEWHDAVESSWGPAVYNLPYLHRSPVDAPDWKKACRLRDMATRYRPEDVDEGCIEMALMAAQLDGRAGKASGERFILINLVHLGSYADALRYLETYPAAGRAGHAVIADPGIDPAVDPSKRRNSAQKVLSYLVENARTSAHLQPLATQLLGCCDAAFQSTVRARAAQARNPALHVALTPSARTHTLESVYAAMRDALARRDLETVKACLLQHQKLGAPPLGPLLNANGLAALDASTLLALFEAGVIGEPCTLGNGGSITTLLQPATEEAGRFRALFEGATDANGATWMHHFLGEGREHDWTLAHLLCASGISIFVRDHRGRSPLSVVRNAHVHNDGVSRLLSKAPAPWPVGFEELRTGHTDAALAYWTQALQDTPVRAVELVRCAAWTGDAACLRLALQHAEARADVDAAMACAVAGERWDLAEILLDHGAGYARGLEFGRLSGDVVRRFIGSRAQLENLLHLIPSHRALALCALHTVDNPLVDMAGVSLPVALFRVGHLETLKRLWRQCSENPLSADELLQEALSLPVPPNVTSGELDNQVELAMKLLDTYPRSLAPDTSFPVAILTERLAPQRHRRKLSDLQELWRVYRPGGEAPARVSALACAVFLDLACDNRLTPRLADRGFRLLPQERALFATWLKQRLQSGFLSPDDHVLLEALVRGGMSPKERDRSGRTLLHLCRYSDIFDRLVAAGADPDAMDFKECVPNRPDGAARVPE